MKKVLAFVLNVFPPVLLLAACNTVPDSIVQRPTSTRPEARVAGVPSNGAIFQAATYRPLFEDRRARHVGDMLTIVINEKTSAGKTGSDTGSKTGSTSFSVGKLLGLNAAVTGQMGLNAKGDNKFED
jgi:flagellar L-ring protein precursor FlgH